MIYNDFILIAERRAVGGFVMIKTVKCRCSTINEYLNDILLKLNFGSY